MNTRDLTPNELAKIEVLSDSNITYELLFLTGTGLSKSILDATAPIAQLLKDKHVHDYDSQGNGPEHKVVNPCIILSNGNRIETKASLYKANTRGDTRFWVGRLHNFASADQVFALFIENENIIALNLSDGLPVDTSEGSDFSEIRDRIELGITELGGSEGFGVETQVEDAVSSEVEESSRFEVSSYGWDSDVEGLVKRLNRKDIKLPGFQRGFVWSATEQSRFIESLILGLPVPNIFLAQDRDSKTLNIIDGQQRLKTLQRYLAGDFSISNSKKIHQDLRGCYYNREVAKSPRSKVLDSADERTLSDSILHSIVIRPDPTDDSSEYGHEYNKAVIQIFRRLNTSGKALQPQEVRSCIFYGPFDDLLHTLNKSESWRNLFGPEHSRYKDVETVLRFLALNECFEEYKAPMPSFLDSYMEANRNMNESKLQEVAHIFETTVSQLFEACGSSLFKTGGTLLLSKFDAVTVGFARALSNGVTFDSSEIKAKVEQLLQHEDYIDSTNEFINDTGNVLKRVRIAIQIFGTE